jgi:hypothetical protein
MKVRLQRRYCQEEVQAYVLDIRLTVRVGLVVRIQSDRSRLTRRRNQELPGDGGPA